MLSEIRVNVNSGRYFALSYCVKDCGSIVCFFLAVVLVAKIALC